MKRPYVQIEAKNKIEALRQHLDDTLPMLKTLPGIVGIILNGGMSRGYADHLSEVDVTLYLDTDSYNVWQKGKAPISLVLLGINSSVVSALVGSVNRRCWPSKTRVTDPLASS